VKILAISDVHVYDWKANSRILDNGYNNRLYLFKYLGEDILHVAKTNNVDVIVLAGDLVHSPVVSPNEAHIIENFLNTLTSDDKISLVMINGNHDIMYKGDNLELMHSIIPPFLNKKSNYFFPEKPEVIDIKGTTFHLAPWSSTTFSDYKDCDVFVGHGAVIGCKDVHGYEFKDGFPKSELFENYKLSIIGDIHHSQLHSKDGRYIVQPGNTVCNSFSDSDKAGCWIIELGNEPVFIDNKTFPHADEYYHFITADSESDIPKDVPKNTFYKIKNIKKESVKALEKVKNSDILELYKSIESDPDVLSAFEELYYNSKEEDSRQPVGIKINKLKITNFQSIGNFELDFTNLKELLIVGKNGSGKSSVFSSLFFALTGEMDRDSDLNGLIKFGEDELFVEVEFSLGEQLYKIERSRHRKNGSLLNLIRDGVSMRTNTISNTQTLIYDIIGCSKEDIFTFCYFSANNYVSFSSLKDAQKYQIVSKLAKLDKIDAIRDSAVSKFKESKQSVSNSTYYLSKLEKDLTDAENRLDFIPVQDTSLSEIELWKEEYIKYSSEIEKLLIIKAEHDSAVKEQSLLDIKIKSTKKEFDSLKNEFIKLNNDLDALKKNTCSTCNQPYTPLDLKEKISLIKSRREQIISLTKKAKSDYAEYSSKSVSITYKDFSKIEELRRKRDILERKIKESSGKEDTLALIEKIKSEIEEIKVKTDIAKSEVLTAEKTFKIYSSIKDSVDKSGELTTELLKNTLNLINSEVSRLLSGTKFEVKLTYDQGFTTICKISGNVLTYGQLSSGEKKVVELATIVAFNNIFNSSYSLCSGLIGSIFLDEIFTFLDVENLNLCKSILDNLQSDYVVITHEEELKNLFSRKVFVEKINGCSDFKMY